MFAVQTNRSWLLDASLQINTVDAETSLNRFTCKTCRAIRRSAAPDVTTTSTRYGSLSRCRGAGEHYTGM